jgi:outer membrane protein insertion porin family
MTRYAGRTVQSIELPGVPDRDHLLEMIPQKTGQPLDRDQVRESIRILFATGRFADIQAEVTPSGQDVRLTFTSSLNFFVGAIDVEGAPSRPSYNQIVNASKFQLGELHTLDKLDRGLQNIRQLMQENGYYRARVSAESTSNPATQQVNILFHIAAGEQAHIGEVKVSGHSAFSADQVQVPEATARAGASVYCWAEISPGIQCGRLRICDRARACGHCLRPGFSYWPRNAETTSSNL